MNTYLVTIGFELHQSDIDYRTIQIKAENADEANYKVANTLSNSEWVEWEETVKI